MLAKQSWCLLLKLPSASCGLLERVIEMDQKDCESRSCFLAYCINCAWGRDTSS